MEDQNKKDNALSTAIMISLDIEQNFKLLSYRIIDQDVFMDRISELCYLYLAEDKKRLKAIREDDVRAEKVSS